MMQVVAVLSPGLMGPLTRSHAPKALMPGRLVPARYGGDDGKRVGGCYRSRCLFGKIAHIFVVEVQVNKGAHLSLVVEQVFVQLGIGLGEAVECFADGRGVDFYGVVTAGKWT